MKESRVTVVASSSMLGSVFKNNNRVITCIAFHCSILRIIYKSVNIETFLLMIG